MTHSGAARALWYVAPERVELRPVFLPNLSESLRIRTLWSGISRGTERLVFRGQVPQSEHDRMRCPRQEGNFPFPVKYGYALVGRVEDGPEGWAGKTVFTLHPHQDLALLPISAVTELPEGLPPRRAVLAANMETALNGLWDSGIGPGDRVAVVGGGVLGCLIAYLAGRIPGCDVTLVDIDAKRARVAEALGVGFALPDDAPTDCDLVFHTSASTAGLATALGAAGLEASVIEMSWYGDMNVSAPLGEGFHSRRLKLISSQVSMISPLRRPRWSYARRLGTALDLLCAPALHVLLTHNVKFAHVGTELPPLFTDPAALAVTIQYED